MIELMIEGAEGVPSLRVRANPTHAQYHYLAREALRPPSERYPATAEAAELMRRARFPRAVQGYWSGWEPRIVEAGSAEQAAEGVRREVSRIADAFAEAMRGAEGVYMGEVWPRGAPALEEALDTLRTTLSPHWIELMRAQGEQLDIAWPEAIDACLVPECYDWRGGYSHPLTLDAGSLKGVALCETVLHEATHVGDVRTNGIGGECFGDRLMERLQGRGLSRADAWHAWHAVIFAASGRQARRVIEPDHPDYAVEHGLYGYFKVPDMPRIWDEYAVGSIGEEEFAERVWGQVADAAP